jgi:hypothetical protein
MQNGRKKLKKVALNKGHQHLGGTGRRGRKTEYMSKQFPVMEGSKSRIQIF